MRKNDDSPQYPTSQKPNRPKSVADGNPRDPSNDSSTSSNNSRSSEKSNKSGKSVTTSLAPSKPDTVATKDRERLRAKQLEEKPYKAEEHELQTFRQMAEEVERKEALKTQRPANALFEKAVNNKTYRLANRSASYTP